MKFVIIFLDKLFPTSLAGTFIVTGVDTLVSPAMTLCFEFLTADFTLKISLIRVFT